MKAVDLPVVGAYSRRSQDDPQLTLNFLAEKTGTALTLKPRPGGVFHSTFSVNGGGRGMLSLGGRLFGVRGAFFQEILADGTGHVIGSLASTQGKVAIVGNLPPDGSGQILVVDDVKGYVYDFQTGTFVTLTEADNGFVGGLGQAVFCAGRALAIKPGSGQVQFSTLYDFTDWPGTNFFTAESFPDDLVALASTGNLVYLFGSSSFEVWKDEGYTFPYTRIISGDQIGCQAPHSVVSFQKWVYWLGSNPEGGGVIYRHSEGGRPERITDHALERDIAQIHDQHDATGDSYQILGHSLYLITFFTGNKTWAYDDTTGLWAEQARRDRISGTLFCMPYITTIFHEGDILALDYRNGDVFRISADAYTDGGAPIRRERIMPVFPEEGDWMTYCSSLELFGQVGIAEASEATSLWSATSPNPVLETLPFIENLRLFLDEANPSFLPVPNPVVDGTPAFVTFIDEVLTWMLGVFPGPYSDDSPNPVTQTLPFLTNLDSALQTAHTALYPGFVDPKVMLSVSRDRGMTWGQEDWQSTAGAEGYDTRVRWTGLGSAFGFTFRLAIVANCFISWRGIRLNIQEAA